MEELGGLAELASRLDQYSQTFRHFFHTSHSNAFPKAAAYLQGLLQASKRNIERIGEQPHGMKYHNLHHFIAKSPWDEKALCDEIAIRASQTLGRKNTGLLLDPTGIAKKGKHSVGVSRQWLGSQGKVDNGQLAVSAALVNGRDACLINNDLYLPKSWTEDPERCARAGIPPEHTTYRTTGEIVSDIIAHMDHLGVEYDWIGMDSEFGKYTQLLEKLQAGGKVYVVDVAKNKRVYTMNPKLRWKPKRKKRSKNGSKRKPSKRLSFKPKPKTVQEVVANADGRRWKRVHIRDSTTGPLVVRVLHLRVWVVDSKGKPRRQHLIARQDPSQNKIKYTLSNAPGDMTTQELAYRQAQRFWVEQSFKECKQQVGLDEYQVRQWRAFHHNFAMVMLLGLFMMETRLENGRDVPLLSAEDIRYLLIALFPKITFEEALEHVRRRHIQRRSSMRIVRLE